MTKGPPFLDHWSCLNLQIWILLSGLISINHLPFGENLTILAPVSPIWAGVSNLDVRRVFPFRLRRKSFTAEMVHAASILPSEVRSADTSDSSP